jgi:hypothetical protein
MKKLIALSIVLTVLASAAFALDDALSIGGSASGTFVPIRVVDVDGAVDIPGTDKDESAATVYAGVGDLPKAEFTLKAEWEKIGGSGTFNINGGGAEKVTGGDAFVWIKPWGDVLMLKAGKFGDGTLEGKVGGADFDYTVPVKGGGDIFSNFSADGNGTELVLKPLEGLYIAAMLNGIFPKKTDNGWVGIEAKHMYQKIQVGVGYEIANIGHARVQFKGDNGTVVFGEPESLKFIAEGVLPSANAPKVEVAFALTAVENLTVDLGAKIWFAAKNYLDPTTPYEYDYKEHDDLSYTKPLGISLGAQYTLDDFSIRGRVDTEIGAKLTSKFMGQEFTGKSGLALNAHLTPTYNLGFAKVGAEIGFLVNPKIEGESGGESETIDEGGIEFGLGAFIQKSVGTGFIRTGVGVALPTVAHKLKDPLTDVTTEKKTDLVLTIPIYWEYSF